jgi:hypothetical protein
MPSRKKAKGQARKAAKVKREEALLSEKARKDEELFREFEQSQIQRLQINNQSSVLPLCICTDLILSPMTMFAANSSVHSYTSFTNGPVSFIQLESKTKERSLNVSWMRENLRKMNILRYGMTLPR